MYRYFSDDLIQRESDNALIPNDPLNTDWRNYQAWLDMGNSPNPAPTLPDSVPQVISRFQARAALLQEGLLKEAEALVNQADDLTKLAWAEAVEFKRGSPMVLELGSRLGLTEDDLDTLFRQAAAITI